MRLRMSDSECRVAGNMRLLVLMNATGAMAVWRMTGHPGGLHRALLRFRLPSLHLRRLALRAFAVKRMLARNELLFVSPLNLFLDRPVRRFKLLIFVRALPVQPFIAFVIRYKLAGEVVRLHGFNSVPQFPETFAPFNEETGQRVFRGH